MRFHQIIAVTGLALACALAPARAEKRVALVIGNDRYANLATGEQLQKAVNDAHAVGGALKGIGFEVIAGENLGRRALLGKLGELIQRIDPGDTALFFFSGHGVAVDGVNYVLPADVPDIAAGQETLLKGEALAEPYVISELTSRGARVAVVVLDACRTNPFSRAGGKGVGFAKGLAPPPPAQGVFSLYAASSGQAALDRLFDGDSSPNSVFSRVLVPMLAKPGIDLRDLAFEVRQEVARIARTAGHDQRPEDRDGTIGGRIYLAGPPPAGHGPVSGAGGDAAQVWRDIQGTASLAVLDDFIRRFGDAPIYGPRARERREEVAKSQVAVAVTPLPGSGHSDPPPSGGALTAAQERGLKRGDRFRECADCPEMVVVPAGAFMMGSPPREEDRHVDEGPQHVVTISRPFAVGRLHVTVDQYAAFTRESGYQASSRCYKWKGRQDGSWRAPGFAQEGSHPVVCVSWEDAKAYANWMAKKTGKLYRLLSEAEFEYAARGRTLPGSYPRFWFGDAERDLCRNGNGADQQARDSIPEANSWTHVAPCNDGHAFTSPAGHFAPNAFGLYDMAGNAWQWTEDCWHGSYNEAPADGSAWTTACIGGDGRVVRGGSWHLDGLDLRGAQRSWNMSLDAQYSVGFRLARTLTP